MKWFGNMKIWSKLMLGFGIVIFLTIVLVVMSVITSNMVDDDYTYLLDYPQKRVILLKNIKIEFINMRRTAVTSALETGYDDKLVANFHNQFNQAYDLACGYIDEYIKLNNDDTVRERAVLDSFNSDVEELRGMLTKYKTDVMDPAMALAYGGTQKDAKLILAAGGPILTDASELVNEMSAVSEEYLSGASVDVTKKKDEYNTLFIVMSFIIVVLSAATALLISRALSKPLSSLRDIMNSLAHGNMNINRTDVTKDEIGQLMLATYKMTDEILRLISEMNNLAIIYGEGEIDVLIDSGSFDGSYAEAAESANKLLSMSKDEILVMLSRVSELGDGNFNIDVPVFPGKKIVMTESLSNLKANLESVAGEIGTLVQEASVGKLDSRADTGKYKGDWAKLLSGMNRLMEEIVAPIREAAEVMKYVSAGDFSRKVEGAYHGDFMIIKSSINDTVTNVATYINEISSVLSSISKDNNLDISITREYVGKFSEIKAALNEIIDKFNGFISDVHSASEQVASGARQISESSMTLAQGATEQASAVQELNATVTTINESTAQNAQNAKEAKSLSEESKGNAQKGNKDMDAMLSSMDGIADSSANIAKIIKVIDDIAFQTNLLALNAAVEAARAGEHGTGFAVVAEEVRSLAGRSLRASKEITDLIDVSNGRVVDGAKAAKTTATTLYTIVEDVEKVSDIIADISKASEIQSEAIGQVTEGINQITSVVQSNSATSQEAASASQELSSQAEVLRNLIGLFRIRS